MYVTLEIGCTALRLYKYSDHHRLIMDRLRGGFGDGEILLDYYTAQVR